MCQCRLLRCESQSLWQHGGAPPTGGRAGSNRGGDGDGGGVPALLQGSLLLIVGSLGIANTAGGPRYGAQEVASLAADEASSVASGASQETDGSPTLVTLLLATLLQLPELHTALRSLHASFSYGTHSAAGTCSP